MTSYVIGMGSSLGEREMALTLAVRALASNPSTMLVSLSRIYQTPPAGGVARGSFLNAAVLIEWSKDPKSLLNLCKKIEITVGRKPSSRWGDRRLDLDILWRDEGGFCEGSLRIPHSELNSRSFALFPLLDLVPHAVSEENEMYMELAEKMVVPSVVGVLAQPPVRVMKGCRRG
jgi:2-amino-4-hydroxy-6-hydroxymethyldihydropteridine diphosphokinase